MDVLPYEKKDNRIFQEHYCMKRWTNFEELLMVNYTSIFKIIIKMFTYIIMVFKGLPLIPSEVVDSWSCDSSVLIIKNQNFDKGLTILTINSYSFHVK